MTRDDAWRAVARECPLRIIGELHRSGDYAHGTAARYPGKVLCCHRDELRPEGWRPTEAQQRAVEAAGPTVTPAPAAVPVAAAVVGG